MPGSTAWGLGSSLYNRYNTFLFQPVIDYNIPEAPGGSVSFSTGITANWEARSNQEWTAPLGFAVGKMLRIGSQAINAQVASYYNVLRPDTGPERQMRVQISFLFPR